MVASNKGRLLLYYIIEVNLSFALNFCFAVVYGVTTGFGKFEDVVISQQQTGYTHAAVQTSNHLLVFCFDPVNCKRT